MRRPVTIGQASLDAHGLDGSVCLWCGDYDPHDTQCEPDAERYPCSQCDKRNGPAMSIMHSGHVEGVNL